MIKKYNDNYIELDAVIVVTAISDTYYDGMNERYMFQAVLSGGASIGFKDNDKERLQALRERIVKDWMEAKLSKKKWKPKRGISKDLRNGKDKL